MKRICGHTGNGFIDASSSGAVARIFGAEISIITVGIGIDTVSPFVASMCLISNKK